MPKSVGGGGGGRAHRHVMYVPSVKNQYKRVVFGCMVVYVRLFIWMYSRASCH